VKILIVDSEDNIIGTKEREERTDEDIIRVSGATIINSKKEILIAQRSFNKKYNGGKWTVSAAGTLEEGETYISNIIKEIKEELGITVEEKELIPSIYSFEKVSNNFYRQMYFVRKDIPLSEIIIQHEEVEKVKWVGLEDLIKMVEDNPDHFTSSFPTILKSIIDFIKK
jgi:isopentenyldiphosphate isomerase